MKSCEMCGKTVQADEHCYEIRYGYIDETGQFQPDEDVAVHCEECGVERGNFNS